MSIIQTAMTIRNKCNSVAHTVRDFLVHHRNTWLPYGAILVFLTSLWFLWDGPEGQTQTIRETKNDVRSSSPVFSATETEKPSPGALVYSTASSIRTKPLPDLFAPSLPKQEAEKQATPGVPIAALPPSGTQQPQRTVRELTWPTVRGTMQSGAHHFVILSSGTETKICGPGDSIDGFYIAYVHAWAVGLQKEGQERELVLTGGSG